jgi:hypothetical protein
MEGDEEDNMIMGLIMNMGWFGIVVSSNGLLYCQC